MVQHQRIKRKIPPKIRIRMRIRIRLHHPKRIIRVLKIMGRWQIKRLSQNHRISNRMIKIRTRPRKMIQINHSKIMKNKRKMVIHQRKPSREIINNSLRKRVSNSLSKTKISNNKTKITKI